MFPVWFYNTPLLNNQKRPQKMKRNERHIIKHSNKQKQNTLVHTIVHRLVLLYTIFTQCNNIFHIKICAVYCVGEPPDEYFKQMKQTTRDPHYCSQPGFTVYHFLAYMIQVTDV